MKWFLIPALLFLGILTATALMNPPPIDYWQYGFWAD